MTAEIRYEISPHLDEEALNALFSAAWENHAPARFQKRLRHSLLYAAAFAEERLVGFVNVAWDGERHAFLLDATVHPDFQRRQIGTTLVRAAIEATKARGVEWLHVDYEAHLEGFYRHCGFRPTLAGLLNLKER